MTRPRPTIRNVADRAGVSKSLVSLVMRGSPQVSEQRRLAVLEAARELGYRPNAVARSLVEGRTHLVGALIADLHDPFYAEFLEGLQETLHSEGLRLLISSGRWDPALEAEAVEAFLELRVDGLVLLGSTPANEALGEAARYTATVLVGESPESPWQSGGAVDSVLSDDELGSRFAVDHLVGLGHRRIAHIEGAPSRREGYRLAMRHHGLQAEIKIEPGEGTDESGGSPEEGGLRAARAMLSSKDRPTAIFAGNDAAALGALTAAQERHLEVPKRLSVVGYDDTCLAASSRISLTTVGQPRRAMGRTAAGLLSDRIADSRIEPRARLLPPHLVVRASTGPAAHQG